MTVSQWKSLILRVFFVFILAISFIIMYGCRTEYYEDGKIKSQGFNLGTQGKGSYGLIVIQVGNEIAEK